MYCRHILWYALIFCFLPVIVNAQAGIADPVPYKPDTTWPALPMGFAMSQPTGIGIDSQDHIFVFHRAGRTWTEPFPDSAISANTVLELDNETGKILNAWGAGVFIMPHGLTVDKNNNIWLTDVALQQVFKFSHDGNMLMRLGVAGVAGNDSTHFNKPTDVAVADDGSFYVSDGYGNSRVIHFTAEGNYMGEWGSYGKKPGQFIIPHGIAIDKKGMLYVADRQNNRVQVFDNNGIFLRQVKNDAPAEQVPSVAFDKTGKLFAIDYDRKKKINKALAGSTVFGFDEALTPQIRFGATGTAERTSSWFHDIAVDSKGNIYAGDITNFKLVKFKPVSAR